jgi:hypothetical protein
MEELESYISQACSPEVSPCQRDEAFGKLVALLGQEKRPWLEG